VETSDGRKVEEGWDIAVLSLLLAPPLRQIKYQCQFCIST
jgi:hypothetical protein